MERDVEHDHPTQLVSAMLDLGSLPLSRPLPMPPVVLDRVVWTNPLKCTCNIATRAPTDEHHAKDYNDIGNFRRHCNMYGNKKCPIRTCTRSRKHDLLSIEVVTHQLVEIGSFITV